MRAYKHIGFTTVGDPNLGTIYDVLVTFFLGSGLHRSHIGTRVGLTHGKSADPLSSAELGEELLLLGIGSVSGDLVHTQVRVSKVRQSDRA